MRKRPVRTNTIVILKILNKFKKSLTKFDWYFFTFEKNKRWTQI